MYSIRIWDLPTRLFHWSLALCVIALAVTGSVGGDWMVWHMRLGHAVLALLLFRLIWGLVGGLWSRFGSFLYSPVSLFNHLKGQAPLAHTAGHSPLGALSVFALLLVLSAQVGTGLISDDEIATFGPLVRFVPGDWVSAATSYHKSTGKWLIFGLVGLHLLAIAFYRWIKQQSLTRAMWVGDKQLPEALPASRDSASTRALALALLLVCATAAWWVYGLGRLSG